MSEIQVLTELFASRPHISWRFPPQQIPADSTALADLDIKHRELVTITERSQSLSSISFETDSELARIESEAFYSCSSPKSITIPRHVQILCSECFSYYTSLSSISFETESELARVEALAFNSIPLSSVVVPANASFVVRDAFPSRYFATERRRCGIQ
jgi:hypothetical protein